MIYFDAAYIAKCYLNEPGADKVIELAARSGGLCSCEYGRLEFFCALHRHHREGHMTNPQLDRVVRTLEEDEADGVWHWLPVTSVLLGRVSEHVRSLPRELLIRAGDSLHLGCARENAFREIYTSDSRMLACARYFDLRGINIL